MSGSEDDSDEEGEFYVFTGEGVRKGENVRDFVARKEAARDFKKRKMRFKIYRVTNDDVDAERGKVTVRDFIK